MEHDDMTSYLKVTQGQTRACILAHITVDGCSCPYCPVRLVQRDAGNECWLPWEVANHPWRWRGWVRLLGLLLVLWGNFWVLFLLRRWMFHYTHVRKVECGTKRQHLELPAGFRNLISIIPVALALILCASTNPLFCAGRYLAAFISGLSLFISIQ